MREAEEGQINEQQAANMSLFSRAVARGDSNECYREEHLVLYDSGPRLPRGRRGMTHGAP